MSHMLRSITRSIRSLKGKECWYHKPGKWLDDWWQFSRLSTWYYNLWWFNKNLPTFVKMAWNYRTWDFCFEAEILSILLEKKYKILADGPYVNSTKYARRCLAASGHLRKAYLEDFNNKTLAYLAKKNPWKWGDRVLTKTMVTNERIYQGMWRASYERQNKIEKELKRECWEYIHKYSHQFGD